LTYQCDLPHFVKAPLDSAAAPDVRALVEANRDVLETWASYARATGQTSATVVLVLIEVESRWRRVVDGLMPETDWTRLQEEARETGGEVMACGLQPRDRVTELLTAEGITTFEHALRSPEPGPGAFHVVVCTGTSLAIVHKVLREGQPVKIGGGAFEVRAEEILPAGAPAPPAAPAPAPARPAEQLQLPDPRRPR
jgi:hypothetical protein